MQGKNNAKKFRSFYDCKCIVFAVLLSLIFITELGAHPSEFTTNVENFPMGTVGALCGNEFRLQAYNMAGVGQIQFHVKFELDKEGKVRLTQSGQKALDSWSRTQKAVLLGLRDLSLSDADGKQMGKNWSTITESGLAEGGKCFNNPDFRKYYGEALICLSEFLKDKPGQLQINGKRPVQILGESNWNFHYYKQWVCYCPHCRKAWTEWLKKRYTSIDELNNDWKTSYRNFEEVDLPRPKILNGDEQITINEKYLSQRVNPAHWMSWLYFRRDSHYSFMRDMGNAVKSVSPDVIITTGGFLNNNEFNSDPGSTFSGHVNRILDYGVVDAANIIFFGGDHLPTELGMYDAILDQTHSALGNKPGWVNISAEQITWCSAPYEPSGEDVERMEIMGALYGMVPSIEGWYSISLANPAAVLSKKWQQSFDDGIYNQFTKKVKEKKFQAVKRAYNVLQKFGPSLASSNFEKPQIAILWAWESNWHGIMSVPVQMLVRSLGYQADFVEQEDLDPAKFDYKALIISSQPRLSSKSADNIRKLADKGVAILLDAYSAREDWCGREQGHNILSEVTGAEFANDVSKPFLEVSNNFGPFQKLIPGEQQPLWAGLIKYIEPDRSGGKSMWDSMKFIWADKSVIQDLKRRNRCEVKGAIHLGKGYYKELMPFANSRVVGKYDNGKTAAVALEENGKKTLTVGFNFGWEYWKGQPSNIHPLQGWRTGYFDVPPYALHVGPRYRDFKDNTRLEFFRRFMQGFLNWAGVKKTVEVKGLNPDECLVFRNIKNPTCQFVTVMDTLDVDYSKDHPVEVTVKEMPAAEYKIIDQDLKDVSFDVKDGVIQIKTIVPKGGYKILMIADKEQCNKFMAGFIKQQ